jgi:hypothetical protein
VIFLKYCELHTLIAHADRASDLRWGWINVHLFDAVRRPLGKLSREDAAALHHQLHEKNAMANANRRDPVVGDAILSACQKCVHHQELTAEDRPQWTQCLRCRIAKPQTLSALRLNIQMRRAADDALAAQEPRRQPKPFAFRALCRKCHQTILTI